MEKTIFGNWVECKECLDFEDCSKCEDRDGCYNGTISNPHNDIQTEEK